MINLVAKLLTAEEKNETGIYPQFPVLVVYASG